MDFKSLLSQLDQLNEEEGTTVHKGTYGTSHGKEDVRDQYGHKIGKQDKGAEVKKDAPKKGRGRPKKGADDSGEVKSYDFSAFGVNKGKDVKLPKYDKKKTVKHSLKEYLDQLDTALNEEYTTAPMPGAVQVKDASGKVVATAKSPQAAEMFKKGEVTLGNPEEMNEEEMDEVFDPASFAAATAGGAALGTALGAVKGRYDDMKHMEKDDSQIYNRQHKPRTTLQRLRAAVGMPSKNDPNVKIDEKDIGKRNNATTGFAALAKKTNPKIAGAQLAKMRDKGQVEEADQPPRDALASPLTLEAKKSKPDFPDIDNDDNTKETIAKAAQDAKKDKKKVKEGMNTRLKAARHAGKSHALGKQGYNCSYDDMEESRHYHEGFKEGLDECYGQMPIQGYVGEVEGSMPAATVPGMASQEQHGGMDEGNAFTAALKRTPTGGKFSVGGDTYTDRSSIEESPFAFESLEKQLNALLESKEDVAEGMTVSISKGQQGAPDSVSVSAQDGEADQLLSIIKSAGLGLFGGDEQNGYGAPQGQPQHGGLDVVGDHDGMMALIKKVTGGEAGNGDYADEEGHADEHGHEGACESCGGMMEAGHSCDEGQQMVDEVESEDQMTYQMAEDNPPDSGADNTDAAIADTAQANQAAAEYNPRNDVDEGAGGPEASEEPVEKLTPDEEDQSDEEGEEEESAEEEDKADKESMSESMFVNLYKKLTLISEESTSEKDDKAEKAAKKVAKDIEYDEDHKGKDDDKAEEAGKKVKKDIEYDDKKDKKEKKLDEWANDAGKNGTDTSFETDIDFMMNVISGGLNKRKSTGQTTIPVIAGQNRTTSRNTTDINETVGNSSDAVAQWKKLAGLK
jgi:hypothetical protein